MRIDGVHWHLGTFPFRFEFWNDNWNQTLIGRLLTLLHIREVEESPEQRGVEFYIGRTMEDGDTIGDCCPYRFTEAQLNGDLKSLGLGSDDIRYLATNIERECRRHGITESGDWRLKTAQYLRWQENVILFEEVCAANPGRCVSMDGAGIMIG